MNTHFRSVFRRALPVLALIFAAVPRAFAINVTEGPDFSNTSPGITHTLTFGTNTFSGTVTSPLNVDGRDYFQVTVPPGMRISRVSKTVTGGAFSGAVYFNGESIAGTGTADFTGEFATPYPLPAGTYEAYPNADFSTGSAWSITVTVESAISWTTSDIAGPADVSTAGTLVGAMNVGPTSTAQTVNGVTFAADPGGTGTLTLGAATVQFSFEAGFVFTDFWTLPDPGGSASYATALDCARWSDSALTGTVTLGGLVTGKTYQVQLWIADSRGCCNTRNRTVDGVSTNATGPQIATGIFTAGGPTQAITIAGVSGSYGPQLNLLQLREMPPFVAPGAKIVWVSDQFVTPTVGGLPDQAFVDLLTASGHTVTRYNPPDAGAIPAGDVAMLNAADLIILGRSMNTAAFDLAAETQPWNVQVTKPILNTSGYLARANRLGWFAASAIPDVLQSRLTFAADPVSTYLLGNTAHTAGTTTNNMFQSITPLPGGGTDRGMSVNTDAIIAGGTVLATTTDLAGGKFIATWPAGTTIPAGISAGQVLGGPRMQFLAGNREAAAAPGNSLASAGFDNLSAEGRAIFLRAVTVARYGGRLPIVVANTADSGAGSLRQALADAAAASGADTILFGPTFNGEGADTIVLTSGELAVNDAGGVTIDASTVPGGVTVSGNNASRVFDITGGTAAMRQLTITGGNVGAGVFGGGIRTAGNLTMSDCTISGNTSGHQGGGLANFGTITLDRCTISGNSAAHIGAFHNEGVARLTLCTISGNTAAGVLGGLGCLGSSETHLTHCTISGNTAVSTIGGVAVQGTPTVFIQHSIIAGNTAPDRADIGYDAGTLNVSGVNLIGKNQSVEAQFPAGLPNAAGHYVGTVGTPLAPLLGSLADNGGPTRTRRLQPGSPAINRATGSTITADQRGVAVEGVPDIGAYEYQNQPPTFSTPPADQAVLAGKANLVVPFTVADVESGPAALTVVELRRGAAVVPGATFGGSGANRTVSVPGPLTLADDGAVFTIVISDGSLTAQASFTLTVVSNEATDYATLVARVGTAAASPGADTVAITANILFSAGITITDADGVTLDGTGTPGGVILDGNNATRLFTVDTGASLTLKNLTLTRGNGSGGNGGAISSAGTVVAEDCTFSANAATGVGGAILSSSGSALTLTRCTVSGNTASFEGGGVRSQNAAFTATNCTFSGNTAVIGGSCSIADGGPATTLTHCTVAGNTATSTVVGGPLNAGGGGLFFYSKDATLSNCIIAGNTSPVNFGADIEAVGGVFTLSGNVVGNNDTVASIFPAGPLVGTTATPLNARLAPLASNGGRTQTHSLLPGSPALDAGVATAATTDQRGFTRSRDGNAIAGALPDAGAYEAQLVPFSIGFNMGDAAVSGGDTLGAAELAGVFAQGNWNHLAGENSGLAANTATRFDATGATLPDLKLWWRGPNTWRIGDAADTADKKLMFGYLDSNGSGDGTAATDLFNNPAAQPYVAIAGLPAILGGYRVLVYADGDLAVDRVSSYWLASNTTQNPANVAAETPLTPRVFLRDSANFTTAYTRATGTSDTGATTSAGNYVQFDARTETAFTVRAEEHAFRAPINAIQIVRNEIIVVTTAPDENDPVGTLGTGVSLREAIRDAAPGSGIVFDGALSGATIALGGELLVGKNVVIDASSLPGGITLSGGGAHRVFTVNSGTTVALLGLTMTGGNGTGSFSSDSGGAVFNTGTLALDRCTLVGNTSTSLGGALYNGGIMTVTRSTLASNTSNFGGGIINYGALTVTHSTISGNTATNNGGGIDNGNGTTIVLTLANSIVAGNTASTGAGINNFNGTVTRVGANLVQSFTGVAATGTGTISNAAPLLAPLGNYGGPTKTMALLPGSPARNAATGSTATTDQRGFPIVGTPDIGAYEAGTLTDFDAWVWETLPAGATPAQRAPGFDYDGDGRALLLEYAGQFSGTVGEYGNPMPFTRNAGGTLATIVMPYRYSAPDVLYIIERSTTLSAWTAIATVNGATNLITFLVGGVANTGSTATTLTFTDTFITGQPKVFYRLKITQQ